MDLLGLFPQIDGRNIWSYYKMPIQDQKRVWNKIFPLKIGDKVFIKSMDPKTGEIHYEFGRIEDKSNYNPSLWRVIRKIDNVLCIVGEENLEKWEDSE